MIDHQTAGWIAIALAAYVFVEIAAEIWCRYLKRRQRDQRDDDSNFDEVV